MIVPIALILFILTSFGTSSISIGQTHTVPMTSSPEAVLKEFYHLFLQTNLKKGSEEEVTKQIEGFLTDRFRDFARRGCDVDYFTNSQDVDKGLMDLYFHHTKYAAKEDPKKSMAWVWMSQNQKGPTLKPWAIRLVKENGNWKIDMKDVREPFSSLAFPQDQSEAPGSPIAAVKSFYEFYLPRFGEKVSRGELRKYVTEEGVDLAQLYCFWDLFGHEAADEQRISLAKIKGDDSSAVFKMCIPATGMVNAGEKWRDLEVGLKLEDRNWKIDRMKWVENKLGDGGPKF